MLKLGGNVDCWCGKCKMILAHTIEAMVGVKPARVHCNTCRAQHSYKPNQPGESSGQPRKRAAVAGAGATSGRGGANRYHALLKGKDMATAKNYSIKESYVLGDLLQHPSFGFGVATAIKDVTKVEVLFESGPKVLIHGR
jgi:hypothetical protein